MAHSFHDWRTAAVIRRRPLLLLPIILVALAAGLWFWLLHTQSGARWIWARVQLSSNGVLQSQAPQGDLGSGLLLRQLVITSDSVSIEIEQIRLAANLDLVPLRLLVNNVVIEDSTVRYSASGQTAKDSTADIDPGSVIERLQLPLSVIFADIHASNTTLSGFRHDSDILLQRLELAGSWHEEIIIDRLRVTSSDSSANVDAALLLERPFPARLKGNLTAAPALTGLAEVYEVQLQAEGSLAELQIDATSAPVELSVQGSIANVLQTLSWDFQAQLSELQLELGENDEQLRISDARAASSGNLQAYSLSATATVEPAGIAPLRATTVGTGTATSFAFSQLGVRSTNVDFSGTGRVDWGENWLLESQLDVGSFDLSVLLDEWPAEHPIRGELALLLDADHVAVSDSYLAAGDSGLIVRADGNVDFRASIVAGSLSWENAFWPMRGDEPTVSSKSGTVSVAGSIDDWRVNGDVNIGTPSMPLGQFRIDGNGDRNHVEATILDSEVLDGKLSGYASFNWRDQRQWSAGLDMSSIELAAFAEHWPNDVSGRVDADGTVTPFLLKLQLSEIDAEFLGSPLSANGAISFADERFNASELKILHGNTRVQLDGDPFARSGLEFDIAVADVSQYLLEARGEFAAAGQVSLHSAQPYLRIDGDSVALSYGDIVATGIQIVDQSADDSIVDAQIKAEQVDIRGNVFEDITIGMFADSSEQSLRLTLSSGDADVGLFATGAFDDVRNPQNWRGELRELNLALDDEPTAELAEPVQLAFSRSTLTVDRGCIAANSGMRLCGHADWSADALLDIDIDLDDVPVNLINRFVDTNLQFDQFMSGEFSWLRGTTSGTAGEAKISMTAGTIVSEDYPDISVATDASLLSFRVANGQLLSGDTTITMPGLGHVAAQFSIPDIAEGENSEVNGSLNADLSDIALLAAVLPVVDEASGAFRAELKLTGTLSLPQLVGKLAVKNGSVTYLPIGLRLDQINLSGSLQEEGQVELSGDFRAGEGRGEIVTRSDYAATSTTGFELELRGEQMTLIDVPEIKVRADADMRISYDYTNLNLDGRIVIPHARVKPKNLGVTLDTESADVVIVAGQLPEDAPQQTHEPAIQIAGSVAVALGDDVLIELGPATAKLSGDTTFTWEGDLIPIADGRYDLAGSVQAFGQLLEVTDGGLRFPKIPANNPFIRVRAEREIYGNAQVKTAGVLVDGTAKQPTISAYTRPATTEERALTLLVTGSDFDFEQGQGAIDFGTYVAPRVFVSYGVGLFETESVIRVRYDLNRSFGVTATSGEKEAGLDISYRIER
jgi:translocation and assembly module TamB